MSLFLGNILYRVWLLRHPVLTLCDPLDCSPPGSSVHGIFQARILEWIANSSSRGSSWPKDRTHVSCISCIGGQVLYHLSHQGSPHILLYLQVKEHYTCRWEGCSRWRWHMNTCGWFVLMYGRNQHNIVKQISCNKKFFKVVYMKEKMIKQKWWDANNWGIYMKGLWEFFVILL